MTKGVKKIARILAISAVFVISLLPLGIKGKDGDRTKLPDDTPPIDVAYTTIWDALINFDLAAAALFNPTREEDKFISAMYLILEGDYDYAESVLKDIYRTTENSFLRNKCERILIDLLFFNSRWIDISNLDEELSGGKYRYKDDSMLLVDSFCSLPSEIYSIPEKPQKARLKFSHTGAPILELYINGAKRSFWFDTGANYTVLSSKLAKDCNVRMLSQETSKALTPSIRRVNVKPAVIDSLSIGDIRVFNHPVVVVSEIDLKFKFFGSHRITWIDGIVGWKFIQNFDVTIDYNNEEAIFRKPVKDNNNTVRNFFWLGCPVVRIYTAGGVELNFGLDTGAERSSITNNIFRKLHVDKLYNNTKTMGVLGGWVYNNSYIIPEITLVIDNKNIDFENLGTAYQYNNFYLKLDGFLGSDIAANSSYRIDWLNGRFEYFPGN